MAQKRDFTNWLSSNLSAAEDRVRELEAVLSSLIPGVTVESILTSFQQKAPGVVEATSDSPSGEASSRSQVGGQQSDQVDSGIPVESGGESLPEEVNGFDWAEHELPLGGLADGMAALSINPAGAGYLGELILEDLLKIFVENRCRCYS